MLKYGADVNFKDFDNKTALDHGRGELADHWWDNYEDKEDIVALLQTAYQS